MARRRKPARRGPVRVAGVSKTPRLTRRDLRALVRFVADAEGRSVDEVDLAVVDGREMARLNRRYLGHRGPTDVLSFDLADPPGEALTGQIVVCADVAATQARRRGHSARRELMLYVVHGLLHLTGWDDATDAQAQRMHAREDQLLADFGAGTVYARERN